MEAVLFINGQMVVAGPKSAALAHPDGTHRLVYCVEASESWLEDFGEGTLIGEKADLKALLLHHELIEFLDILVLAAAGS